jgi:putative ABC transport system substrate-binding protein
LIGFLNSAAPEALEPFLSSFLSGLRQAGFVEGRSVKIEYDFAQGQPDELRKKAAEFVNRKVTLLVANATAAALAAKSASSALPIVFVTGSDPVEIGLVDSLNRPGGNATGVSFWGNKLVAKRLELLNELMPSNAAIGMLVDANNPNTNADLRDAKEAAGSFGRRLVAISVRQKTDLVRAFAGMREEGIRVLFVAANVNFVVWREQIVALATGEKIAASYPMREYVVAGGLMSYGPNQAEMVREAGVYAGRIIRGANPADLPIIRKRFRTRADILVRSWR